jgi:hypothetical protein
MKTQPLTISATFGQDAIERLAVIIVQALKRSLATQRKRRLANALTSYGHPSMFGL